MTSLKRTNPFQDVHLRKMRVSYHDTDVIMISTSFEKELKRILTAKFLHYLGKYFVNYSESRYDSDYDSE